MRKLTTIILGFSALGILPAASFAEDQAQVAEKLLEAAFACPAPPSTQNEADQPVTAISRSTFSGNGVGFRVTSDVRILADIGGAYNGQSTGPDEMHRHSVYSADYRDLARAEIVKSYEGGRRFEQLHIECRSGRECFHQQSSQDAGPPIMRQSNDSATEGHFEFCDEETIQNAKAAFDVLIASAPPAPPHLGIARRVKSSVSGGYINLRTSPGLNSIILAQIPAGESISVDESSCRPGNDGKTRFPFCPVKWHGQKGWASASGFE